MSRMTTTLERDFKYLSVPLFSKGEEQERGAKAPLKHLF
jgi:hypothetical protein